MLLWSVPSLAGAPPALAHGFGQRYDLPVPLWLYLYGAVGAVLLSFVVFGLFVGERGAARGYPRLNLLQFGLLRATLASRAFVSGLRVVSVALFGLVVLTGLFGDQTPVLNLKAPRLQVSGYRHQERPAERPWSPARPLAARRINLCKHLCRLSLFLLKC